MKCKNCGEPLVLLERFIGVESYRIHSGDKMLIEVNCHEPVETEHLEYKLACDTCNYTEEYYGDVEYLMEDDNANEEGGIKMNKLKDLIKRNKEAYEKEEFYNLKGIDKERLDAFVSKAIANVSEDPREAKRYAKDIMIGNPVYIDAMADDVIASLENIELADIISCSIKRDVNLNPADELFVHRWVRPNGDDAIVISERNSKDNSNMMTFGWISTVSRKTENK
ncbi:MAG: hypothetical protein ACRC0G_07140 [Fusobacteriaceae bacterium]